MRSFEVPGNSKKKPRPAADQPRRPTPRYGLRAPEEWNDIREQAGAGQSAEAPAGVQPAEKIVPETALTSVKRKETQPQAKRPTTGGLQQDFFQELRDRRPIDQIINKTKTPMPKFGEPQVPQAPQPVEQREEMRPEEKPGADIKRTTPEDAFNEAGLDYKEALDAYGPDDSRTMDAKVAWEQAGKNRPSKSSVEIAVDEQYYKDHPEESPYDPDEHDEDADDALEDAERKVKKQIEKDKGGL